MNSQMMDLLTLRQQSRHHLDLHDMSLLCLKLLQRVPRFQFPEQQFHYPLRSVQRKDLVGGELIMREIRDVQSIAVIGVLIWTPTIRNRLVSHNFTSSYTRRWKVTSTSALMCSRYRSPTRS